MRIRWKHRNSAIATLCPSRMVTALADSSEFRESAIEEIVLGPIQG